jgi:hypothetical protein
MGEHAPVVSSQRIRRFAFLVPALACVASVVAFGELSIGALVAVAGTGVLVTLVGLRGRAGAAAPRVGRRALPWAAWLGAAVSWELVALFEGDVPTVSDLADPVLAHPPARGAATVGWLVAGAWLLARPSSRPAGS